MQLNRPKQDICHFTFSKTNAIWHEGNNSMHAKIDASDTSVK